MTEQKKCQQQPLSKAEPYDMEPDVDPAKVEAAAKNENSPAFKTYKQALESAEKTANRSRRSTLVYESTLRPGEFGVAYTLPTLAGLQG